jgi:hypothetical protein
MLDERTRTRRTLDSAIACSVRGKYGQSSGWVWLNKLQHQESKIIGLISII